LTIIFGIFFDEEKHFTCMSQRALKTLHKKCQSFPQLAAIPFHAQVIRLIIVVILVCNTSHREPDKEGQTCFVLAISLKSLRSLAAY
jgi:hypothetical protein